MGGRMEIQDQYKFATMDIEGDGLKASVNQQIFKDGMHFDPGTIPWVVTFAYPAYQDGHATLKKVTVFHKLPPEAERRMVCDPSGNPVRLVSAYHDKDSFVYNRTKELVHEFIDVSDKPLEEFIEEVNKQILYITKELGYPIVAKGYYSEGKVWNYDQHLLSRYFRLQGLDRRCLDDIYTVNIRIDETERQIWQPGCPNEQYLNIGLKHNIEDTVNLWKAVYKEVMHDPMWLQNIIDYDCWEKNECTK